MRKLYFVHSNEYSCVVTGKIYIAQNKVLEELIMSGSICGGTFWVGSLLVLIKVGRRNLENMLVLNKFMTNFFPFPTR